MTTPSEDYTRKESNGRVHTRTTDELSKQKITKARGTLTIKQYKSPLKRKTKIRRKTNKLENYRVSYDQFTWESIIIIIDRKKKSDKVITI